MHRSALTTMLLIAHIGAANAAAELSPTELDQVSAGGAWATATATALGNNVATSTFTLSSSSLVTNSLTSNMQSWLQRTTAAQPASLGLSTWFRTLPWSWQQ